MLSELFVWYHYRVITTSYRIGLTVTNTRRECCGWADVDECQSSPCLNGGTCTDLISGYSCSCTDSYTGTNCTRRTYTFCHHERCLIVIQLAAACERQILTNWLSYRNHVTHERQWHSGSDATTNHFGRTPAKTLSRPHYHRNHVANWLVWECKHSTVVAKMVTRSVLYDFPREFAVRDFLTF